MNHLKIVLVTVIVAICFGAAEGQQVPLFSQYIMNGFLVNPSLAGRDGYTTVNLTVREQWMGVKDAPSTYAASFQTALLRNSYISRSKPVRRKASRPSKPSNVGLGGYLFSDNNGIIKRTGFQFDYAYHIPMGRTREGQNDLSLGLGLVTYVYTVNLDKLKYSYADDPFLNTFDRSVFITDFNFGASYTSSKYYVGFSMTNILRGALVYGNTGENKMGELGHYFLTGGYNFVINRDWSIKPSAFIKSSDLVFKSIQIDLTGRVFYKENYWAGISYRSGDAIIGMFGLRYDKFYFGYAFDFTLTDIRKQSYGSMEITLAVKFGESARRFKWLNAF
jgi:type IX secretion system PorP/SprF family membrane protein